MELQKLKALKFTSDEVKTRRKGCFTSFGKIEEAEDGQLAFLANPKYEEYLYSTKASVNYYQ
jgi:UDP-3-O-[3-hydroxymyristoyl] glucosamine N-acyltransferase